MVREEGFTTETVSKDNLARTPDSDARSQIKTSRFLSVSIRGQ
jgi:hypothetical protein